MCELCIEIVVGECCYDVFDFIDYYFMLSYVGGIFDNFIWFIFVVYNWVIVGLDLDFFFFFFLRES